MSVPLFNLIVVNERAIFGSSFNYYADRYMENIILHGANRCFVFQATVLISGILLLIFSDLGIEYLWMDLVVLLKTIGLFVLMSMLSYVHFSLQPKIEKILATVGPESEIPENFAGQLKPYRVRRKKMATFCLFLVITIIILGMQVYTRFDPVVTVSLIVLAGLFSLHVSKTLIRFGWV